MVRIAGSGVARSRIRRRPRRIRLLTSPDPAVFVIRLPWTPFCLKNIWNMSELEASEASFQLAATRNTREYGNTRNTGLSNTTWLRGYLARQGQISGSFGQSRLTFGQKPASPFYPGSQVFPVFPVFPYSRYSRVSRDAVPLEFPYCFWRGSRRSRRIREYTEYREYREYRVIG